MHKKITPLSLFLIISFILTLMVGSCFYLAVPRSDTLKNDIWGHYFWCNPPDVHPYNDTGMDFFHSIEYLKGNSPYAVWNTIYPPLANLFFKICYSMIPVFQKDQWELDYVWSLNNRIGENSLRDWLPTMMLFIIYNILIASSFCLTIADYFKDKKGYLLSFSMLMSYAVLYAFERGNIILLALVCALFFCLNYNSESKVIREIALLSLAVSANIKLYPALFGIILIFEKKWKEAARLICYGIIFFILPCLFFNEKLSAIPLFFQSLQYHTADLPYNSGISAGRIIYSIMLLTDRHFNINLSSYALYLRNIFNIIATIICLLCSLAVKKKWGKILSLTLAFVMFSDQPIYISSFLIIPAILFFRNEEYLNISIILPFIGFIFGIVCLPIFDSNDYSYTSLSVGIGVMLLFIYIVFTAIRRLISTIKPEILNR